MRLGCCGGARYDSSLTPEQRSSAENGIWLCQVHGKLVDNDEERFPVDILRAWKALAEAEARRVIERPHENVAENREGDNVKSSEVFVGSIGVWFDSQTKLHYCPKCRFEGKRSPLKNNEHGFTCHVCNKYYPDSERPYTARHVSYPRGPHSWMAN